MEVPAGRGLVDPAEHAVARACEPDCAADFGDHAA